MDKPLKGSSIFLALLEKKLIKQVTLNDESPVRAAHKLRVQGKLPHMTSALERGGVSGKTDGSTDKLREWDIDRGKGGGGGGTYENFADVINDSSQGGKWSAHKMAIQTERRTKPSTIIFFRATLLIDCACVLLRPTLLYATKK